MSDSFDETQLNIHRTKMPIWTYSSRPYGEVEMNAIFAPLDSGFSSLYSDYFGMTGDDSLNRLEEYMRDVSYEAFEIAKNDKTLSIVEFGDMYFENYTPVWNDLLKKHKTQLGLVYWTRILRFVRDWEGENGFAFHKGSLYYFASVTAAQIHDFEATMIFMHLALQEDKNNNTAWKSSPANSFLTLNGEETTQFYKVFVKGMAGFVRDRLDGQGNSNGKYKSSYCSGRAGNLSYEQLRAKFLDSYDEEVEDLKYYFVFATLRFWHTRQNQKLYIRDSIMSPILYADALNSLLLTFECLLKFKLHDSNTKNLYQYIGKFIPGILLHDVAQDVDKSFSAWCQRALAKNSIMGDFELAYGLRNFTFHNIQSQDYIEKKYSEINQSVFNCLFYIFEKLY